MSLIDKMEELGWRVAAGELGRSDAIHQLQQFSDGGLTRLGAEKCIDDWRTQRAAYAEVFRRTEEALTSCLRELGRSN